MFKLVQSITTLLSTAAYANKAKFLIYFYWLQTTHWNSNFISAKKMVVLTSHLLSDAHRYILRCLASHQAISHCTIFTSISEVLIYKAFSNTIFLYQYAIFLFIVLISIISARIYISCLITCCSLLVEKPCYLMSGCLNGYFDSFVLELGGKYFLKFDLKGWSFQKLL